MIYSSSQSQPQAQAQIQSQAQAILPQGSESPSTIDALDLAYHQALYQVFSEHETISIRVGRSNPILDQLLQHHGHNQWALITAYNPYSRSLTAQANQWRNDRLAKDLWSLYLPVFRAVGQDDAGQWPAEESFFVIGLRQKEAIALGQKYDQNAILVGKRGHAPQLLWIR